MPATAEAPSMQADQGPFPESEFATFENVPVFAEHTTEHKGRMLSFGPTELQHIVNRCNQRISNSGDYAVICLGHTPSSEARDRGVPSPPAIGFAGPFRLGQEKDADGNVRYSILADFHIYRDQVAEMKRHPRRSAELWVEDTYEEMFLDPIALLGSEPPRLDMGLLYARNAKGREVLKYSSLAPGAGNVFVPRETSIKRHAAEEFDMDPNEIVQRVVDGIMELPVFRWAQAKMEEEQGAGDTSGVDGMAPADDLTADAGPSAPTPDAPAPSAGSPPPPADAPPAAPAPDMGAGDPGMGAPDGEPTMGEEEVVDPAEREKLMKFEALDEATEDMSDEDIEEYAASRRHRRKRKGYAAGCTETMTETSPESAVSQYSRNGSPLKYAKRIEALEKQLKEERGARIDEQRKAELMRMAEAGIELDVAEEMGRLCYSKLPDNKLFVEEANRIRKHYSRLPTAIELPELLVDSAPTEDRLQYQKANADKISRAAAKETIRRRRNGERVEFADVFSEMAGAAAR